MWLVAEAPGVATWIGLVQPEVELHFSIRNPARSVVEAGASHSSVMMSWVVVVARKLVTAASRSGSSILTVRRAEGTESR